MIKTNAMRILDQKKISYEVLEYPHEDGVFLAGEEVANLLGINANYIFKTIVTIASSKKYYVFVIPVLAEINLRKCAKIIGEKSLELIPVKSLTDITGYVRGGCSPIGMKKQFATFIDETAKALDYMIFSAGKIGFQIKMNPNDLAKLINASFFDLKN